MRQRHVSIVSWPLLFYLECLQKTEGDDYLFEYAGIIVNNESSQVDRLFTYKIPEMLLDKIAVGSRVKVPFGMGNKTLDGFVMELYDKKPNITGIKPIRELCEDFPVISNEDIVLINKMREKYLSTYIECIKAIVPSALINGIKNKTAEKLYSVKAPEGRFSKENYYNIYKLIFENPGTYTVSELSCLFNFSASSINTLIKHGFIVKNSIIVNRYNQKEYENYEEKVLNEEQKNSVNIILNSKKNRFLIHGITGSGKTEIYMNLVSNMLQQDKSSIILVPEIALTPQMVERFKGRFGRNIAVFHSRLSDGERYDEWLRVKQGKVKVAIGARSAIFLPFSKLGLIVIDEEHENSYKSDSNPKYNAREIAELKQEERDLIIVLGSATPSVETYYRALNEEYKLIEVLNRADGAELPSVEVVDMRRELAEHNLSMFSRSLYNNISESLLNNEQIILFLNRRGYSNFISCRKCGYVFRCESCDISLTYHSSDNTMVCHYCGKKERVAKICPKCGSKYVKYFGVGTEKVEQEVKKYFPQARVIRMDFDTTRKKNSYETIYNDFKDNKADILIGTQMIAKGLDFKNVTLVGVIAADLSLNLPDFRSAERTFQLLTQVSGRAGRGNKHGKVVIQTYSPENYSIKYASLNDYKKFYDEDINIRYNMNYPPFAQIMNITLSSEKEELLIKKANEIGIIIREYIKNSPLNMLGPCPCEISKIKDMYRWHIVLKGSIDTDFAKEIKIIIYKLIKNDYNDIRVNVDINPNSLL